jgi:predicted dehydrogenase
MTLRVGLVGAGPWARIAHAPILTGGPETSLVGVWARRQEAAEALVADFGGTAWTSYDELLDSCDAVAFAVPPEVQAQMAEQAARAGKHLLLDKPVAADVAGAERLAGAVGDAGVATLVVLSMRFVNGVRDFVRDAQAMQPSVVVYESMSNAFLEGPFSQSPWRHAGGVLPDVGPHVVDLLTRVLGPVAQASAESSGGFTRLQLTHVEGGLSQALLSAHYRGQPVRDLRAYSDAAELACDWSTADPDIWGEVRRTFADIVSTGAAHDCDVQRGLELQRVLATV